MPIDSTHPQYTAYLPYWQRMRDAVAGEDAIKAATTGYLPLPAGHESTTHQAYRNYLSRARYPDAIGAAVEGMVGLMGRKEADIELPDALERMRETATPDGLPLDGLLDRLRYEVATLGRHVLLTDVPEGGGDPYITAYPAESCINWRTDGDRITLLVLYESVEEPDPEDPLSMEQVDQWRVCVVREGVYQQEVWRKPNEWQHVSTVTPAKAGGEVWDEVPAVIVGSRDLLPEPDSIPLLGVANRAIAYYRQYADYAMQLYMSAHGTTPYIFGVTEQEQPATIGPDALWVSDNDNASAGFIEISGTGLEAQRAELDRIQQEIAQATVQALSSDGRQAESGEALRLRHQHQTATLASIARSTARGLERALRWCCEWRGIDPEQASVTPDTQFVSEKPDAQLINALKDGVERGLAPLEILSSYMRRVGLHEMDDEAYLRNTAAGQALPAEE